MDQLAEFIARKLLLIVPLLLLGSAHHVLLLLVELPFIEELLLNVGVVVLGYVLVPAQLVEGLLVVFESVLQGNHLLLHLAVVDLVLFLHFICLLQLSGELLDFQIPGIKLALEDIQG